MVGVNKYINLLSNYKASLGHATWGEEINCFSNVELGHYKATRLRSENGLFFLSWFGRIPRFIVKKHGTRGTYTILLNSQSSGVFSWSLLCKLYYITFLLFKNAGFRNIPQKGLNSRFFERVNFEFENDLEFQAFSTYRLVDQDVAFPMLVGWWLGTSVSAAGSSSIRLGRVLSEFYFRSFQLPMSYFNAVSNKNIWFY